MKIKELIKQIHINKVQFGAQVKIIRVSPLEEGRGCHEDKDLVGQTGTLTNPFTGFPVEGIGIFLDNPELDCCNLGLEDEVKLISKG